MEFKLNSLVLYTEQVNAVKCFYEHLGFSLNWEKHGAGPEHYSTTLENGVVLEIYAGPKNFLRLEFEVLSLDEVIASIEDVKIPFTRFQRRPGILVNDPDGRRIEIVPQKTESD